MTMGYFGHFEKKIDAENKVDGKYEIDFANQWHLRGKVVLRWQIRD